MPAHVRVSGVYQVVKEIHARVSGTYQRAIEGWTKVAGVWQRFYSLVKFAGYTVADVTSGFGASCSFSLLSDGTIAVTGNASPAPPGDVWTVSQPITGIGSQFWVRLTVTAGSTPTGSSTGVWLALSSTRTWTIAQAGIGTNSSTCTLEFSSDSGGAKIVASNTLQFTATRIA